MADTKISALTEFTAPLRTDYVPIVDATAGATKRVLLPNLSAGNAATLVVAASDAIAKSKRLADYVCDGTADDVQIQAAINALPAGGGKVLLSEGTFNIAADVSLPSKASLEGMGSRVDAGTWLKPTADNLKIVKVLGTALSRKSAVAIRNLAIGETGQAGITDIHLEYADEVLIENVALVDAAYGIYGTNSRRMQLANSVLAGNATDVYLTACPDAHLTDVIARDATGDSIVYSGTKSAEDGGLRLSGVLVIGATVDYGIKLQGVLEGSLSGVRVDTTGKGIYVDNTDYLKLADVWVGNLQTATQDGITLGGGTAGTAVTLCALTGITVVTATRYGIYLNFASDIVMSGVVVHSNQVDGIRLAANSDRCSLAAVRAVNNGQSGTGSGVYITGAFDVVINGLVATDTQGVKTQEYGVVATGWCDNVRVAGGDLSANKTGAVSAPQIGSQVKFFNNVGYLGPGEVQVASGDLTAGNANAFAFAWQNPHASKLLVKRVLIYLSAAGGTAGALLDVGKAADGTTHDDTLIDGLDINQTGVFDNINDAGTNGKSRQIVDENGGANDWVTGQILTANAASLVGRYEIEYQGV